MEKEKHHSEHIGTIIEQWFKRFELKGKNSGKVYPIIAVDVKQKTVTIQGGAGLTDTVEWDEVPVKYEILIREA